MSKLKAKEINRLEGLNGNGHGEEHVPEGKQLTIKAPHFQVATFTIRGTSPYVQNKFSSKARDIMRAAQEAGDTRKKDRKKEAKDFQECYELAMHRSSEGWCGIPASGLRAALVSACKACGFAMTRAKLSVFVQQDGVDADDATPLVRITKGEPSPIEHLVRVQQTADIRVRPMWAPGWESQVRIRFDADQFTLEDVANLLMRVGLQVGVGEGRPDSRTSAGMGWGLFELVAE